MEMRTVEPMCSPWSRREAPERDRGSAGHSAGQGTKVAILDHQNQEAPRAA